MILTVTRQDMQNVTTTSVRGNAARVGPWTSMESVPLVRFQKFITFLHVVELLLFFFRLSFFLEKVALMILMMQFHGNIIMIIKIQEKDRLSFLGKLYITNI